KVMDRLGCAHHRLPVQLRVAGPPSPALRSHGSNEKESKQSPRQGSTCATECSLKVATPVWRKRLQGLQQHPRGHQDSPDHERARPSEGEQHREPEIARDVVELPTQSAADLPIPRAKGGEQEQEA